MPSQRKRIGFLPSEKVHKIIDKLCRANEISQSKVTGLLVEEALKSRGVLIDSYTDNGKKINGFENDSFEESLFQKNKSLFNNYTVNKESFSDDIKMMQEFVEFKYFKKVMNQNKHIFE